MTWLLLLAAVFAGFTGATTIGLVLRHLEHRPSVEAADAPVPFDDAPPLAVEPVVLELRDPPPPDEHQTLEELESIAKHHHHHH